MKQFVKNNNKIIVFFGCVPFLFICLLFKQSALIYCIQALLFSFQIYCLYLTVKYNL